MRLQKLQQRKKWKQLADIYPLIVHYCVRYVVLSEICAIFDLFVCLFNVFDREIPGEKETETVTRVFFLSAFSVTVHELAATINFRSPE